MRLRPIRLAKLPWYVVTLPGVLVASLVARVAPSLAEHGPFLLLFASVVFAAHWYGRRAALATAAVATFASAGILAADQTFPNTADGAAIVSFLCVSFTLAWVISNRQRFMQALQASEHRHRTLLELLPDGVIVRREDQIIMANQAASAILGAPNPSAVVGRSVLDFVQPCDREIVLNRWRQLGRERIALTTQRVIGANGVVRDVELAAAPADMGDESDVVVVMRDITEHASAQRERSQLAATLGAIIDAAPLAIISLDADRLVRSWNAAAERIFGWTRAEVIGRPYPLVLREERATFVTSFASALAGRPTTFQTRRQKKDGTAIEVMVATAPVLNEYGCLDCVVALITDMTEQRTLEAQFRQAQKLEAIGRLAGGVAHDFNNLLTAISGFAELAMSDLPVTASSCRDDLQQVIDAAQKATALTRQLLAFSRKQMVRPVLLDVNTHLASNERFLARVIGEDVKIVLNRAPCPALVMIDAAQLDQIVMNLAVNARDAMPSGGELRLEVRQVHLQQGHRHHEIDFEAGDYIMIVVADTGHGMTLDVQQRLFEPFFTTKPQGKGTGLGLATVYGAVKQNGGYIWVDSEVGSGTTVNIYLPTARSSAVTSPPRPAAARGQGTVLIVDDERPVAEFAGRVLARQGYHSIVCSTAAEALAAFSAQPETIDLLISDVVMPEMGGAELVKILREQWPELRALYISGYSEGDLLRRALTEPGTVFLEKPFTAESLAIKVQQVISERRRGPRPVE